jgi:uncharacterized cupredoxin-like copper-binding protein
MKKTETAIISALLAFVIGFAPLSVYAHGSNHEEEIQFDPLENEFGSYQPKLQVTRTIKVELSDQMRFSPDVIEVNKGDVIKFEHTNTGQIMHEFVLGTADSLAQHAEMMKKFPGMEHSEPYMAHVPPGETKSIIWKFSRAGEFAFGCLIPGHFDAGMKGVVLVGS